MEFARFTSLLLLFLLEWDGVTSQGTGIGGFTNIQEFLNNLCLLNPENEGCNTGSIDTQGGTPRPRPRPTVQPTNRPVQPTTDASGCYPDEKKCPQLETKCVPREIDCNLINAGITCSIPNMYGAEIQVLICGDDTPIGARCRNGDRVPFLTVILVQCQGSNDLDPRPVSSLDVLNGPGDSGGAGVYRCSQSGSWESKLNSPNIGRLTLSCRNAGCGHIPHPSKGMPVHRRWPWVRGIYKNSQIHCTGTLVSSNALVTAAHCLTSSPVSNEKDLNSNYEIELPGPDSINPVIKVSIAPQNIYLHPRYRFNNEAYQNDIAIMFFDLGRSYNLPTVCISDQPYTASIGKAKVVFDLKAGPQWDYHDATYDFSCVSSVTNRFNGETCLNTVPVQETQFCAFHRDASLSQGSSGGPYLVEVGDDVNEVWVLMGVLSKTSTLIDGENCLQEHSVFGQVAENSGWVKNCVFDRRCAF